MGGKWTWIVRPAKEKIALWTDKIVGEWLRA